MRLARAGRPAASLWIGRHRRWCGRIALGLRIGITRRGLAIGRRIVRVVAVMLLPGVARLRLWIGRRHRRRARILLVEGCVGIRSALPCRHGLPSRCRRDALRSMPRIAVVSRHCRRSRVRTAPRSCSQARLLLNSRFAPDTVFVNAAPQDSWSSIGLRLSANTAPVPCPISGHPVIPAIHDRHRPSVTRPRLLSSQTEKPSRSTQLVWRRNPENAETRSDDRRESIDERETGSCQSFVIGLDEPQMWQIVATRPVAMKS